MPRGRRGSATPAPAARGGVRGGRRGRSTAASDGRLADIVERYVNDLVTAVRQEVRRSVAAEVSGLLTGSGVVAGRTRRAFVNGKKRIVGCIAPGCGNPSKGPRFHYLCDKHKEAKKQDYEAWRKARKEKQAA
jgi:hypothetical protein